VATRAPWPLPAYALSQIDYAGLTPVLGNLTRHDHAHLDVIVDGRKVTVPAGVGQAEPVDGGPCPRNPTPVGDCASGHVFAARVANSPLHTHSTSGIIHVESDRPGAPPLLGGLVLALLYAAREIPGLPLLVFLGQGLVITRDQAAIRRSLENRDIPGFRSALPNLAVTVELTLLIALDERVLLCNPAVLIVALERAKHEFPSIGRPAVIRLCRVSVEREREGEPQQEPHTRYDAGFRP
jgi:hypothetical protein